MLHVYVLHVFLLGIFPGMQLARACAEAEIPCLPVPGACAAVAALSVAGFPCAEFLFFGFLPRRGSALNRKLDEIAAEKRTLIFYEVFYLKRKYLTRRLPLLVFAVDKIICC